MEPLYLVKLHLRVSGCRNIFLKEEFTLKLTFITRVPWGAIYYTYWWCRAWRTSVTFLPMHAWWTW